MFLIYDISCSNVTFRFSLKQHSGSSPVAFFILLFTNERSVNMGKTINYPVDINIDLTVYPKSSLDFEVHGYITPTDVYFERFKNTKIRELFRRNMDVQQNENEFVTVDLEYTGDDDTLYLDHFFNNLLRIPYDEKFYGTWSTRSKEITGFKGIVKCLLYRIINYLLDDGKVTTNTIITVHVGAHEGLTSFNDVIKAQDKVRDYYKSMGFRESGDDEDFLEATIGDVMNVCEDVKLFGVLFQDYPVKFSKFLANGDMNRFLFNDKETAQLAREIYVQCIDVFRGIHGTPLVKGTKGRMRNINSQALILYLVATGGRKATLMDDVELTAAEEKHVIKKLGNIPGLVIYYGKYIDDDNSLFVTNERFVRRFDTLFGKLETPGLTESESNVIIGMVLDYPWTLDLGKCNDEHLAIYYSARPLGSTVRGLVTFDDEYGNKEREVYIMGFKSCSMKKLGNGLEQCAKMLGVFRKILWHIGLECELKMYSEG